MDLGGIGVAWDVDHHRPEEASGADYRADDMDLPNICKTNKFLEDGTWSEDFWDEASGGGRYPSEAEPYVYYMGFAHVGDWVRVTVDVQQAGTYNVSSSWACANIDCGCSIWFNDGSDPTGPEHGINKSGVVDLLGKNDYHIWSAFPNFAQVELTAGPQLMTFQVENADHLQYGYLQFDLVGGGAGGAGGAGNAGAGGDGAGGAAVGGAGGASGGAPAMAGTAGTPVGGTSGGMSAGAGGAPGSAGTPATAGSAGSPTASTGGTGTAPSGPAANGSDSNVDSASGCAHTPLGLSSSAPGFGLGLLLMIAGLSRRRRQR
jgi:hypothetical protein